MLNISNYQRNASQNYNEVSSHTSLNGHPPSKSLQKINSGESVEKREPSYTVDRNVNWYNHYGDQQDIPEIAKNYHMILQSHSWAYIRRKP